MGANNKKQIPEPLTHNFEVVKYNKHDTIYQLCFGQLTNELVTQTVKIEKFQGFSKAYNLGLYFRIKNATSWAKSKQITGLWKTTRLNHFYGDFKQNEIKTLLLFKIDPESQTMCLYQYPKGYYPHRKVIDSLINQI